MREKVDNSNNSIITLYKFIGLPEVAFDEVSKLYQKRLLLEILMLCKKILSLLFLKNGGDSKKILNIY